MDRRSFLISLGGASAAVGVPLRARAAEVRATWHVLYPAGDAEGGRQIAGCGQALESLVLSRFDRAP